MKYYLSLLFYFILAACSEKEKIDYSSTEQKANEKINNASTKLKVLDVVAEQIYMLNKDIESISTTDSVSMQVFMSFDDTLKQIRDELIANAGGYTKLGEYANLPAEKEVEQYFYGKTSYRTNAGDYFFKSLQAFDDQLKKIRPKSRFLEKLDQRFNVLKNPYGLESKESVFKNLNISEAVALLESIRSHVAIEQTEYLLVK